MTDKETLYFYRLKQAEETLYEAEKMVKENFSPRSIINRAYYSMFYAILALFVKGRWISGRRNLLVFIMIVRRLL